MLIITRWLILRWKDDADNFQLGFGHQVPGVEAARRPTIQYWPILPHGGQLHRGGSWGGGRGACQLLDGGESIFCENLLGLLVKPVHAGVSKCYLCSRLPLLKAGDEYRTGRDNSKYFFILLNKKFARIAKAASHKLPGKSSFNVNFVCPVCIRGRVKTAEMVPCGIYYSDTIDYSWQIEKL